MRSVRLRPEGAEPIDVELSELTAPSGSAFMVRCGAEQYEVEFERLHNEDHLRIDGRVIHFHAVRSGDHVDVWMAGRAHRFTVERKGARRGAGGTAAPPTDEIVAPMPGTVIKINVQPGDAFSAHHPLVILESMKMELSLSAPASGRVSEVACEVGELVQMGQVLIRLEPPEDNDAA